MYVYRYGDMCIYLYICVYMDIHIYLWLSTWLNFWSFFIFWQLKRSQSIWKQLLTAKSKHKCLLPLPSPRQPTKHGFMCKWQFIVTFMPAQGCISTPAPSGLIFLTGRALHVDCMCLGKPGLMSWNRKGRAVSDKLVCCLPQGPAEMPSRQTLTTPAS